MASHDDYSSASSFTLRVTGPAARWLVTRTVREAAIVQGRWLRMTITRVLPRLHFGLLGLRPGEPCPFTGLVYSLTYASIVSIIDVTFLILFASVSYFLHDID